MKLDKTCKSCGAEVVFLPTTKGKHSIVNLNSLTPEEKSTLENGGTVMYKPKSNQMTHFATCPDSPMYRRKK